MFKKKYIRVLINLLILHVLAIPRICTIYAQDKNDSINEIPENVVIRHYPLSDNNVNEIKLGKNGIKHGNFKAVPDRWGDPKGAIQIIDQYSYVELPDFFEGFDISDGYSISFWMKVDDPIGLPKDSDLPYLPTDTRDLIFFARKGSISFGKTLFGMSRIRDRLAVNRYIANITPTAEFELWLWDPANLNSSNKYGSEWHFVTLAYYVNSMKVFVGTPDGKFNCRSNYFAPQPLSEVTLWGLGNPAGYSVEFMDEFKVYAAPLSYFQAKNIFETSRNISLQAPINKVYKEEKCSE